MQNTQFYEPDYQSPITYSCKNTGEKSPSKRYFKDIDALDTLTETRPLAKRICRRPDSDSSDRSLLNRQQLGGKGMFLQCMHQAGLAVPPFRCVTASVTNVLEQHTFDIHRLIPYLPGIVDELWVETASLTNIREYLNGLLATEPSKRAKWLAGLAKFVASNDFYELVKDSEAARQIRDLRCQLDELSPSGPVMIRSSGINEDNYGDAQAGKYLSEVQGEEDVFRTCLKVMASGYRPEVCSQGIPQPMALIIQQCINCQYGGVVMSFQSFQDDTIRVEYTPGQPRGVLTGQSGNTPHRIDISYKAGADHSQYYRGTISSHFILNKNTDNKGYSETRILDTDTQSDDLSQPPGNDMLAELREMVIKLEDLLLCPVDVEFAIDHQGRLFLLQVRPVTRLSGDMDFAMAIPEDTLALGEAVSEGYCTGPIWLAKKRQADSMPDGAIVLARHVEEWMLEPEFLKRAGGFVIAEGGFNDHVAILMRQEQKRLLLGGEQFAALAAQDGQQATLACGRFNGKSGAFVVAGDLTEKLASHISLSPAVFDVPLAKAVPSRDDLTPDEGTFCHVVSGFQWLTDQNARLLAFFAPGGGLDGLANPIKVSMSPQRSKLLAESWDNIKRLVHGAEALLDGYRAFLLLADDKDSPEVQPLLDELQQIINRFETLKQTIQSGLKTIIPSLQSSEEDRLSSGTFRQWVAACHQLQSCLQTLHHSEARQVLSVHDLIFALHQCFINALAPVTLASGQGKVSMEQEVTYVDCTPLGEKAPLLTPSCRESIEKLGVQATVVSMVDAMIVNLEFGNHVGIIELLEHAEGGKGRTLRLKFSDQFYNPDGSDQPGRLKRMWFLVQLLKAIELDKNADGMKLSCNAVAGEIIVECPRMTTTQSMHGAFKKLITVLDAIDEMEIHLRYNEAIFEGGQWNFNFLAQRLNSDPAAEADRFAFQHCLFSMFYYRFFCMTPDWCQLLSSHQQQFIDHSQRLAESKDKLQEMLMSGEIGEDTRREILYHLLLVGSRKAIPLFEYFDNRLKNEYFVIKPPSTYKLEFYVSPGQPLPDNQEKVRNVLLKHGLTYASQRVRNDKDLVLLTIKEHPGDLEYASSELRDHDEVVMAAIAKCPTALNDASERIRGDKHIIRMLIADNVGLLSYASKSILNDREYLLDLIKQYPRAFVYADDELKNDEAFIRSAVHRNSKVRKYVQKPAYEF
ncbi:PEP/pyruvate-binding domain-containing protein [Endozoicomonas sp. ISHI1]|uniref:PEP/pyruvate-binding domain-containing protein n=4 Tax=unclassified Endozoicomonas TaxID=2644528 RepID=UPI002147CD6B|nr:PEP/pyruvate-binding domain-containing protein [Endozoicomonas sp. ISHI1]